MREDIAKGEPGECETGSPILSARSRFPSLEQASIARELLLTRVAAWSKISRDGCEHFGQEDTSSQCHFLYRPHFPAFYESEELSSYKEFQGKRETRPLELLVFFPAWSKLEMEDLFLQFGLGAKSRWYTEKGC